MMIVFTKKMEVYNIVLSHCIENKNCRVVFPKKYVEYMCPKRLFELRVEDEFMLVENIVCCYFSCLEILI